MIDMLDCSRNVVYLYDMNKLPLQKKTQIIQLLVEGTSLRAASRITGVSFNTILKLLPQVGSACEKFHNERIVGIKAERVQCDEIWSFVYSKEKNKPEGMEDKAGDVWTWVGIEANTKLVISWFVGDRSADSAELFMQDVAGRTTDRMQLTTDGHKAYLNAVANSFDEIDYAQLIKLYGNSGGQNSTEKKYSPAECTGTEKHIISGNPRSKFISTSYIERQNLTMRMHMRRFTRLTNAFSKKVENHCHAIALHFVYYNFVKIHTTLRVPPAMEAGLIKRLMTIEDIVRLAD